MGDDDPGGTEDGRPGAWFRVGTEAAAGRVTGPERYVALHDAGRALVDRLVRERDVERVDGGPELDPGLAGGLAGGVDLVVRLTPRSPGAAPLVVAFTGFPGLALRRGDGARAVLPLCGCDACDEAPGDLVAELHDLVAAVVDGDPAWPLRR